MEVEGKEEIEVYGARVHNLKNIDVRIPRNKLVVITGLSGSGKSSLAFDTIYAEGQRRYMETFSAYARQFMGDMERPDVDKITGLSPVISIEQKTISKSPRSTVGTITEIYDFLRLLFARIGDAYSYETGERMVQYSEDQIIDLILEKYTDKRISILAPLVKGRKGHYRELFEQIAKQGFVRVRVDGSIREIVPDMKVDRYKIHDIEVVVDRVVARAGDIDRLRQSIGQALDMGNGTLLIQDFETEEATHFSKNLMCPTTGISYPEPEPNLFSFNSPYGVCKRCNGIGKVSEVELDKLIPDPKKSIRKGGITPLGSYKNNWIFNQVEALLEKYGHTLNTPIREIDDDLLNKLMTGTDETLKISGQSGVNQYSVQFEGIVNFIKRQATENASKPIQRWAQSFMSEVACPVCEGTRLRKEALYFKVLDLNIAQSAHLGIDDFDNWVDGINDKLPKRKQVIAKDILKEIKSRSGFLRDVGLDYLALDRSAKTLSGGEAQRIRLATQIGSKLVGVLYILDEPSIGLHQRDNDRLIESLKQLRDVGNSVIVVEHDKDMILAADEVLDIGPGAGAHGGELVSQGIGSKLDSKNSITAKYISGEYRIEVPETRRKGTGDKLTITGASGNNLKNIKVDFPLGKFICVYRCIGKWKINIDKSDALSNPEQPCVQRSGSTPSFQKSDWLGAHRQSH